LLGQIGTQRFSGRLLVTHEIEQEKQAVTSAQQYVTLATGRYETGVDPYLNVITAQTTVLSTQQTALNLRLQQMTASVSLVQALGGGWQDSDLPTYEQLAGKQMTAQ